MNYDAHDYDLGIGNTEPRCFGVLGSGRIDDAQLTVCEEFRIFNSCLLFQVMTLISLHIISLLHHTPHKSLTTPST